MRLAPGPRLSLAVALPLAVARMMSASAPAAETAPTFTRDVAPILAASCMGCHRPGEIAPMSLLTYEDVRPWVRSVRNEVVNRTMPPWYADPRYGSFRNDWSLSEEQVDVVVRWVDAGAPRGPGDFAPPVFEDGWRIGEPDLIVEMEQEFVVPAEGPDITFEIDVPIDLPGDIWVQAAEVRGNTRILHHSLVSIVPPDGEPGPDRLASYIVGARPEVLPEGSAKLVRHGSVFRFSQHYHPSGQVERDRSRVGIVLARGPVSWAVRSGLASDRDIEIPPMDAGYRSVAEWTFDRDVEITHFKPRMHYRGRDVTYILLLPDGTQEVLLSVPRYDMNWPLSYELDRPKPAPAGSRLRVIAHFDNSSANPWNPDPGATVVWGTDSRDERMEAWFDYRVPADWD